MSAASGARRRDLPESHLISVLVLCRQSGEQAEAGEAQQAARRRRILHHIGQLDAASADSHAAVADKLALAQGALRELDGDAVAALADYERAAAHAAAQGVEHIAGIAHERAAALATRRNLPTTARAHAQAACRAYRRWGAPGLVVRLEEALRKAEAELADGAALATVSQLTAAIAHEVNQPLMAISTNAGAGLRWLRREPPRVDQVSGLLQAIVAQSQRAGKIIQTLQALGQDGLQAGSVDLHALIQSTLARARPELDRHGVALALDLAAPHSRVEGDAGQLQQVLCNLVENAIEALAPVQGRARLLRISTGAHADTGGGIEVRVEDNGCGAGEPGLDAMFEPFASSKPDGMGMGLAVCRSIVEAHGGTIRARAGAPHGCSLVFSLPGGVP